MAGDLCELDDGLQHVGGQAGVLASHEVCQDLHRRPHRRGGALSPLLVDI